MLAIIVIVVAAGLGGGIMTFAIGLPSSPCSGVVSLTRSFTIIANSNGFNESMYHQQISWPVLTVHRCDIVKITVMNKDIQTHGLAVDYYATRGTDIQGQQTLSLPPFLAYKTGQFRVYCNSRCTIHEFLQNGSLNVI